MKNNKRKPTSLFEMFFMNNFNDSIFNFEYPKNNFETLDFQSGFPKKDDPNFNYTEEVVDNGSHITTKEIWISIDGNQKYERTSSSSKKTNKLIEKQKLNNLLTSAIEEQRFEDAATLRDKIKEIDKDDA